MKFYLDFAHRFFHDELHFMINMADVPHPHAFNTTICDAIKRLEKAIVHQITLNSYPAKVSTLTQNF